MGWAWVAMGLLHKAYVFCLARFWLGSVAQPVLLCKLG
jgi:hypothetical protein